MSAEKPKLKTKYDNKRIKIKSLYFCHPFCVFFFWNTQQLVKY